MQAAHSRRRPVGRASPATDRLPRWSAREAVHETAERDLAGDEARPLTHRRSTPSGRLEDRAPQFPEPVRAARPDGAGPARRCRRWAPFAPHPPLVLRLRAMTARLLPCTRLISRSGRARDEARESRGVALCLARAVLRLRARRWPGIFHALCRAARSGSPFARGFPAWLTACSPGSRARNPIGSLLYCLRSWGSPAQRHSSTNLHR